MKNLARRNGKLLIKHSTFKNRVIFEVAEAAYAPETVVEGIYNIAIKVELWTEKEDPNGPPCATCTKNELLSIDFRPTQKQQIVAAFKQYEGAHKMKITLLNASPLDNAPPLRLRGEIMVNRIIVLIVKIALRD